MFSLVLVQLKPQQMPKTEVGSLKLELDDLGGCAGLPVFTFHKDGGSKISPQLPEISKVHPVLVQIRITFPCLLNQSQLLQFHWIEESLLGVWNNHNQGKRSSKKQKRWGED